MDPSLLLQGAHGAHAVLFDGGGADSWGDGSWLFCARPLATLEVFACGWGRWREGNHESWRRGDPLELWASFLERAPAALPAGADRCAARFATALAYDLAHWVERLPRRRPWRDEPLLFCAFYGTHLEGSYRAAEEGGEAERQAVENEQVRAGSECQFGGVGLRPQPPARHCDPSGVGCVAMDDYDSYARRVQRVLEYIAAGDVYQVNLSRELTAPLPSREAVALMLRLRREYPMPYAVFFDLGETVLVSNSPECFLQIRGREISTFPIKGTAPVHHPSPVTRHPSPSTNLTTDAKERAEHVMIVDLERNDLGRVCEPGSIEVRGLFAARDYPLLTHMVSEVRGRLRGGVGLAEVVRAAFPGGSITGAPKVRAMQIIEELEEEPRGFYTGAIGWSDLAGNARFNIAIRTAAVGRDGLTYRAGGGIVADSDPAREYEETLVKSEALRRVLQ